jgi:hypothetical protein
MTKGEKRMGYQACFVLLQADQSAMNLINLIRNELNSETSRWFRSLGNRTEQIDLFKELGLWWMYLEEIHELEEIRGKDLSNSYEQYIEVSEGV